MVITAIRERLAGWVVWVIVGLICVTFALWGVQSYFEGLNRVVVAEVNGEEISYEEYQSSLQNRRANMARAFGGNFDQAFFNTNEFRKQTVDELVDRSLLRQKVREGGYHVGDDALTARIQTYPAFQGTDGQFNKDLYVSTLRRQGMSPQAFEQSQREQDIINQIRSSYSSSAFVTDKDLERLLKLTEQEREVDYFVVTSDQYADDIEIKDGDTKKEFDENLESFRLPAKVKVEYVELTVDALVAETEVSEEELKLIYEESRTQYIQEERRRARHILIKLAEDAEEEADKAALEKAEKLLEEARGDADFAELAKENSEDAGSANNGGDLDFVTPDVMVKPFSDALFAMEKGAISEPVRSRFGYHIIKLEDIEEERGKTFDEVRAELEESEKRRLAEEQFVELAEVFRATVFEQETSLAPVTEELDIEIKTSDWVTRDEGEGVFSNPSVREAAFSEEVIEQELNSTVVEVDVETLVAVRKSEFEESRLPTFEEVKETVTETVKTRAVDAKVASVATDSVSRLDEGMSWEDLLAELELEAKVLPAKKADAQDAIENAVSEVVFTLGPPNADTPMFGELTAPGGHVVYAFKSVVDADIATVDEAVREQLRQRLTRRYGDESFTAFQDGLREQADIRIVDENLGDDVDTGYGGGYSQPRQL